MSHPTAAQAAPPPLAPAAALGGAPAAAGQAQPAPSYVDTPALLNRWQLIGMVVVVLFGLLSALMQFVSWQADGRAADDTEQLVRVQEIQSSLLRADALATNTFLVGGQGSSAQASEYDDAINAVLRQVADAAEAQPADRAALAALNEDINDYATFVAQARANNRQNLPVGAAYQSLASSQLRADAIPVLDALVEANTDRAESSMNGQHPILLTLIGLAALAGLFYVNRNLARAFRRKINKGVAIAAVIVLGVTVVAVIGAMARDGSNDSLRTGAFDTAVKSATARTGANDAKANESLRLIKRGSGAANEDAWIAAQKQVSDALPGDLGQLWSTYVARHGELVASDDGNDWERAVQIAISTDESVGTTPALDRVDARLADSVDKASSEATHDLRSGRVLALIVALLTALLGVAASVSVARGVGERRKEFS